MKAKWKLAFDVTCVALVALLVFLFPGDRLLILGLAALLLSIVVLIRRGNKLNMRWVLVFDASWMAIFSSLALFSPGERDQLLSPAGFFLLALVLHALIVPFKGLEFVLHDAPPDSMVKFYGIAIVFPGIMFSDWGGSAIWRIIG